MERANSEEWKVVKKKGGASQSRRTPRGREAFNSETRSRVAENSRSQSNLSVQKWSKPEGHLHKAAPNRANQPAQHPTTKPNNLSKQKLNQTVQDRNIKIFHQKTKETNKNAEFNSQRFGKVRTYNEKKEIDLKKKSKRDTNKQQFKQALPKHIKLQFEMQFEFPQDKLQCAPEEKLGRNLEALDRIRTQCRTYIERVPTQYQNGNPFFRIAGNHHELVQEAYNRFNGVVLQICATMYTPEYLQILAGLSSIDANARFALHPHMEPKLLSGNGDSNAEKLKPYMRFAPSSPTIPETVQNLGSKQNTSTIELTEDEYQTLAYHIEDSLRNLRWTKCNASLHIHLGTYVFSKWKRNKSLYSRDELLELVKELDEDDNLSKNEFVADDIRYKLLSRFVMAHGWLLPKSPLCKRLEDVKPTLTALFALRDISDGSIYQLEQVMELSEDGSLRKTLDRWSKLDKYSKEPKRFLNTTVIELNDGLTWQFDLRVTNTTRAIPSGWLEAVNYIKVDVMKATNKDYIGNWMTFPHSAHFPVQSFKLKRTWSFNINGCDYAANVSLTQDFFRRNNKESFDAYEPYWGLDVDHNQWYMLLIQLDRAHQIGHPAFWIASVEQFFPPDGIGSVPTMVRSKSNTTESQEHSSLKQLNPVSGWVDDRVGRLKISNERKGGALPNIQGLKRLFNVLSLVKSIAMGVAAPLEKPSLEFDIAAPFEFNSDSDGASDSDW